MCQFQSQLALGQAFDQAPKILLQPVIGRVRDEAVQISRNRADVLGNAPFVVVEDANEAPGRVRDVVERLEGNAVGQRRVAEDGDDMLITSALVSGDGHAEGRRQRRAGVGRAVAIVLAFSAQGEAVQAARGADRVKAVFATGEQLVDIALMAHVPDKLVFGGVENAVEGDSQLHHTKVRAEVTAVFGKDRDQLLADFFGELLQLVELQFLDVFRTVHHVEVSVHKQRTGNGSAGVRSDEEESGSLLPCAKNPMRHGCDGRLSNSGRLFRSGIVREVDGLKREFASGVAFQLLDLQLGFSQLGLADFGQPRAFFETRQQGLQGQLIGFHRLDDPFEFFQRLFKG